MFLRSIRVLLLSASVICAFSAATIAATMDYLGTWNSTATYAVGKVVVYNKAIYYSKLSTRSNPNRNRIPGTSTTYWEQVGTLGNTILSGVGNPTSASLGQVGDFYINTQTNTLFGPKTAHQVPWPAEGVSLVGPKGDAGSAAETGPEGPAGPQGETGPAGPQGGQGVQGEQGPEGPEGPQGATGPAGPQGPVGPQGSQGSQGAQGAKGDTGDKGDTGARGDTGPMPPGFELKDQNGATIGYLYENTAARSGAVVMIKIGSQYYRVLAEIGGFVAYDFSGMTYSSFTQPNCAGTEYLPATLPPAALVKVNGYPSINSEKVGTNVTFIYPLAPFQTISVKSQRAVGDVACNNGDYGSIVVGVRTETTSDVYVAPFSVQ